MIETSLRGPSAGIITNRRRPGSGLSTLYLILSRALGMPPPAFVIRLWRSGPEVHAARFLAFQGRVDHQPRHGEQVLQLPARAGVELAGQDVTAPEGDVALGLL